MKTKTKSFLKKKLWKLVSEYVRRRDKGICFTCGRRKEWKWQQCGHYRTGATCKAYLFFDERNLNCQCFRCNINLSGNWREYQRRMHLKYGKGIDGKFDKANQKDGWDYPYEKQIKIYQQKLKELI